MIYVPVKETVAQKRCIKCGFIAVFENLVFESKKIYHCLSSSCGYEELLINEIPSSNDLLGSINKNYATKTIDNRLDNDSLELLNEEYEILLEEINSITEKKIRAESIYQTLVDNKFKVASPDWTPNGWHTSRKFDFCALCGIKFRNRQAYKKLKDDKTKEETAICRYICPRDRR